MTPESAKRLNFVGAGITLVTVLIALLWAFPIYWGIVSSIKPEDEVVRPFIELWPENPTLNHYWFALTKTKIGYWYVNSIVTALGGNGVDGFDLNARRLRDQSIALPGAQAALLADISQLHGSDAGFDHQSFRFDGRFGPSEYLGRYHSAAVN